VLKLKLEQTVTCLQDAGNAQRGYLLTNDPSFLRAFNKAVEETNTTIAEIDSLTIDNPKQQRNVKTLKDLINDRYRLLSLLLGIKHSVSTGVVVSASHFEDKDKMDSIRAQIASMVRVENSLLKEREKAKKSLSSTTPLYSLILSFASLLVIFIGVYKIRNAVKKQTQLKEELSYSKSFLQNILNSTPNGIGCYEAIRNSAGKITDFRIGYINKEITTLYGLIPENIIGKTLGEVFPGFNESNSFKHFCDCVENGNHVEYETESTFNTVHAWFYIQLEKLHDGLTVTFRDITQEKNEAILQLREHNKALAKANADLAQATQRTKQLNEKLLIQNEIFKQAEESSLQGSYSWNLSTSEATFSDNMYRLLGCEPGEFVPSLEEVLKYVHPEDQDDVKDINTKALKAEKSPVTKHRIISKDGKLKYIQATGKIINYGNSEMMVGTMRDITADTLLNQHIKFREAQLTQAQNVAKLGSFYDDFRTNTITWSDELYRLFGYEPGEIEINQENVGNIHPDDLPVIHESVKNAREKGIPVDIEYRRRDKSGKLRYVYSKAEIIRDSSEDIIGLFGVNMDLTDLREKEMQLKESERFNHAILDLAPNVVYIYDLEKRKYVFSNKNILKIAGYTDREIQDFGDDMVRTVIHPEDLDQMSAQYDNCRHLADGAISEMEYRLKTKQGNYICLLSSNTVFTRNQNGEVTQIIGVTIDITEIKKANHALIAANQELERSNQELTSFTYVASHDLQEPLRKIRIFISRILADELCANNKELFTRITSSVGRMNELIESLLNYSRANTTAISKEETDLNSIVEEVKNSLHHIIEEKNAVIELLPLPKIRVVRIQFLQLFTNIIENGIKYSKQNVAPHVQISAQIATREEIRRSIGNDTKTNYWKVSVTDNGIGFEQEYEEKIFDMFQRLHSKTEYNGTGIGLTICKKVIQNHNGFITATGKPGVGSIFNIFIPVN
jgi:PAS domain S-box-containing protein